VRKRASLAPNPYLLLTKARFRGLFPRRLLQANPLRKSKEATKDRGLFVLFEGGTGSTRPFVGASHSNLGSGHSSHVLQG
jgi:hypothetical protein